jgi:transcription antitermination factor NusG
VTYWAVIQTEPAREAVAVAYLERAGFPTYLPRIKEAHRIVPLFGGYAFLRIHESWYAAEHCIGVVRLLRDADRPARVRDEVINAIKAQERGGLVRLPKKPRLMIGQRVTITNGALQGYAGIYQGMSSKARERVLLQMLGQSVLVALPGNHLAPLDVVATARRLRY